MRIRGIDPALTCIPLMVLLILSAVPNTVDATLSPARDVTGTWSGSLTMQDTGPPGCSYGGTATLTLVMNGNDVTGSLTESVQVTNQPDPNTPCDTTGTPTFSVNGTVSSSSITMTDSEGDTLTGSFTTDLMTLNVASPVTPSSGGGKCVEYCGYTQTLTLSLTAQGTSTTSTPPSTTTTSSSATSSSGPCPPGTSLVSPAPGIQLCQPNGGVQLTSTGAVSAVDTEGNAVPVNTLTPGDLYTMNSGSLNALIPGVAQENVNTNGHATLQEIFIQNINNVQLYVPALSSTSTYPGIEAADQVINALTIHGGLSTTLDVLSALRIISCAVACEIALVAYAGYEATEIFIHYQNTVNEQGYPYAPIECNYVNQVLICPRGTEYVVFASANLTNIQVMSGTVLVVTADTAQNITVSAGQQIAIFVNQTSAQDLEHDITPFNPSTEKQWWPSLQVQTTSAASQNTSAASQANSATGQGGGLFSSYLWSSPLAMSLDAAAILAVAGLILTYRKKRRTGRKAQQSPLQQAPTTRVLPTPRARFCPECGTRIAEEKFCANCGKEVQAPPIATAPSSEGGARMDVSMETLSKLTKLKDLLDSNTISMDEYNRMKANILDPQPSEAASVRRFCGSCGAQVVPETAFCASCGASLQRGRTAGWAAKAAPRQVALPR